MGVSGKNVVGYYDDGTGYHGFLYDGSTITTLDPPGSTYTWAVGVSGNNVVGHYKDGRRTADGTDYILGFLYDGTSYTTLFPEATQSLAEGVSGNHVVGVYQDGSGRYHGFLYVPTAISLTSLSPSSATAGGPSFNLTVNGSDFVSGSTVKWNGSSRSTTFVSSTQLIASIPASDIASAGTAQVTVTNPDGSTSSALTFTINNPAPTITSLSPASITVGGAAFTLTVNGTNFIIASTVRWNGSDRTTAFVSGTQLTAAITAADIAAAGTATVTVFNPPPGGGTSNAQTFPITSGPAPAVTTLVPNNATAGGAAFTLTVNGSNFVSGSTVQWNASNRTTTFVSSTQLTAVITAADIATAGSANVTVVNPSPGGGTSNGQVFTISNPVPATTSLSPSSANAGGAAFTLTVYGTSFVSTSTVQWNGSNRTTTFVSATQLTAAITAADIATKGTAAVTVVNPPAGGGTANAQTFTISEAPNPVPTITNLSPNSASAGGAGFTLIVNGTNFISSSTVQWSGSSRITTYVSAIQLTATITAADVASPGTASVTVVNPAPGGGTSNAQTFAINNPFPTLTSLSPSSATIGGLAFTLTANGSNFVSGATVRWNGSDRTTTFVSSSQLTCPIAAADIATAGFVSVTVANPAPGGGTSGTLTFTVGNPVPTISSLSPNTARACDVAFTLTVNGANFLSGSTVKWNGSNRTTTFVSSTQLTAAITAADITTAGTASVTVINPSPGGGTSNSQSFRIVPPNPVPTVTSLSPASITAGGGMFTLTVYGTNFISGSLVQWNWANRTTAFVSDTQLTATIWAQDIQCGGTASVDVYNPPPGGGTSGVLTFSIINPVPAITGFSPASVTVGSESFTLTVNGTNFVSTSSVRWNGTGRSTSFVSSTRLRVTILGSEIVSTGSAQVTVVNPTPGGGTSNTMAFPINNPAPAINSISPASGTPGGKAFTLTVTGSNFVSASKVQWGGSERTTTFLGSIQLSASIPASDVATAKTVKVTVVNPLPGGGTSNAMAFTMAPGACANPLFGLAQAFSAEIYPDYVAAGDFNGDGKIDLAVANIGSDTVSILLGNGNGSFRAAVNYTTGTSPRAVAVADLNGDRKLDLVVANQNSNDVSVLLGNGDGTFQDQVRYGVGTTPLSVASGDFNGDGKADVVTANYGSNDVSILLGNGDGTLQGAASYHAGSSPSSIAIGDFSGDGKVDLAVTTASGVSILLGLGSGAFTTAIPAAMSHAPLSIAVGDFNKDGKLDLALATSAGVSVLLANGGGSFQTEVNYTAGSNANFVSVADINGDNNLDLAVTSASGMSILLGNGTGTFGTPVTYDVGSADSLLAGDFNRDGKLDLAVTTSSLGGSSDNVVILLGKGSGAFQVPASYTTRTGTIAVTTADFNGDGKTDVGTANGNSNSVSILTSNGDGTLGNALSYDVGTNPSSIASADFNGDNKADLVVANNGSNNVSVLLGNGNGTFLAAVNYAAGANPKSVAVGDFNGDGKFDLAVANSGSANVSILLGKGDATFLAATNFDAGTSPYSIVVGDFNGDGKADLATANYDSGDVSILLGNGDGTFQTAVNYSVGSFPGSVAAGDFNGDGKLDLAVTHNTGVAILLGNGDGSFQARVTYLNASIPLSVTAGDFNGDGRIDLAVLRSRIALESPPTYNLSILLGSGDGTFQTAIDFLTGSTASAKAVDLNGDGKIDLVLTGSSAVTVLLNTFTSCATVSLTSLSPSSAFAGGPAFNLTVTGTGFVSGSRVNWNGSARNTTFVSSTQLTGAIPASDIASAGTAQVTVSNPDGSTSGQLTFTINNPAPTITSLNPASATAGGAAFTLTINGSNFVSASTVKWNGSARSTAFISGTQVTVAITAADIATAGTATVTVFNPTPGGGTSNAQSFTINNPAPSITSLSPASATAGGAAFTLSVTGTNFLGTSTVQWNGSTRTTTFVSSTQLTAAIPASDIATAGTAQVKVFNPAPGGGLSNSLSFQINPVTNCSAQRTLPDGYVAGQAFQVTIQVTPPSGTQTYAVEDTPPLGWAVSGIDNSGQWDSANGKVKWGPFFDSQARTLHYTVTPPAGAMGTYSFIGTLSMGGVNSAICGNSSIEPVSNYHPADTNSNSRVEVGEVTAYGSAWKSGTTWSKPPNPIPIGYVTNAGLIWISGEVYHFDSSRTPPACWVPGAGSPLMTSNGALRQMSLRGQVQASGSGSAVSSFNSASYTPGVGVVVSIAVTPDASAQVYAVEDTPPSGWTVSGIDNGGQFDSANRKVKWGLFFDNTSRTLTYTATPPAGETGTKTFAGLASFDGTNVTIGGARTLGACCAGATLAVGMGRFGTNGGWVSTHAGKDGGFALQSWLHLPWEAYNATGGGVHVAVGDVDGDGLDEIVLGLGTGGGGWIAILDDDSHNNVLLKWIQVNWSEYNASNGEVFPAVGDIDGDGRAEIIAGLGTGSQGWVEIFDDASTGYQHMAWRQVAWPVYNGADGTTHPAVGDLDGDGKAEIVLGLGSGGGGWIEVIQSSAGNYNHGSWLQVNWPTYNASNGATYPAVGDIDGDGRAEIVIGLGQGSGGWVEFLDDKAAGYAHLKWFQIPWDAYDNANGETHPAVGNVDADSRAEIVFGLGQFQGQGGRLFAMDDATSNYATLGWFQIPWNAFSQDGGETFPAIGRSR